MGTFYHVLYIVSVLVVWFGCHLCTEEQLKADMQQAKEHIQSGSNPQVGTVQYRHRSLCVSLVAGVYSALVIFA